MNSKLCKKILISTKKIASKLKTTFYYTKQKFKVSFLEKWIFGIFNNSIVFFPYNYSTFYCGLCSVVSIEKTSIKKTDIALLLKTVNFVASQNYNTLAKNRNEIAVDYLGGREKIKTLYSKIRSLKQDNNFLNIFLNKQNQKNISIVLERLSNTLKNEHSLLKKQYKTIDTDIASIMKHRLEILEDIVWCLENELTTNFKLIKNILPTSVNHKTTQAILLFKQINSVLNSIDKLEVRGRDSAGLSIMFILTLDTFNIFEARLLETDLSNSFKQRQSDHLLLNTSISCSKTKYNDQKTVAIAITYKIASEIGCLGDNSSFLRQEIKKDQILSLLSTFPKLYHTISSHTRWASVGAITESNCHPIDNITQNFIKSKDHIIHVCLNGEIDNYLELKASSEIRGITIPEEITTDTKIIPIKIEEYINKNIDIFEAFRLAVNNFQGSHSIVMHTNLAPGKLLVAQKGSGQSMFIGLAENYYIPASEIYGFVEETDLFLRMEGDKIIHDEKGKKVEGQIFILDQKSGGTPNDIVAMYYDGTPINLTKSDIRHTKITPRDIDRKNFKHYFLKEIYESPLSVERTLNGRWAFERHNNRNYYVVKLNKKILPRSIENALTKGLITRIFFIGQGTAGIAAQTCSDILKYFLINSNIVINSLRSSELSGFELNDQDSNSTLKNTLIIAVTQSGTTTDTNHTIDMARIRGAFTLAIVNRRDSDITFKVDGVMYTSNGRDIEMSVASTKAFYSQIIAGNLLCLKIASLLQARTKQFISNQIEPLLKIPLQMREVLDTEEIIKKSAQSLAFVKKDWATVGSGPNKASADEIRIKLSELCYKTISSDFIEDKKHIDLSSEPLILVCAAGSNNQVIGDIVKDIAIFSAHKAIPIVIADKGEHRFDRYVKDVFYVPKTPRYLAPILNTLVGHIWGYHAALSLNKVSKLLSDFRDNIKKSTDRYVLHGLDAFEIIRKKSFRSKINKFYRKLRFKIKHSTNPIKISNSTDLTLLLKYLSGRLPVSDFEIDFGKKGTAIEILKCFFETVDKSINDMSRPIDAIRHQAKTVTVGTSRISSKVNGILFEAIKHHSLKISQLTNKNIIVMKNLQKVIKTIQGSVLYTINKLDSLGEPDTVTEIEITSKSGILEKIPSRVEIDKELKGTKRIVVSGGDIYVGKGRKDGQNIIIIPACSDISHESDRIRKLLLLNIIFKEKIPLETKIRALGGKYENIKNIVHENSILWSDKYLDNIEIDNLFGFSAEKVGEYIVLEQNGQPIRMKLK